MDQTVPIGRTGIGVTPRASDARYATVQVLSAEARILDLASRGRRSGQGRVPLTALMPMGRDGRLDPSQYGAVLQLAGGGDFLSVLTAPAGAGKTSTLGAAARAGAICPCRRGAGDRHRRGGGHPGQVAAHPSRHATRRRGGHSAG
jgi:hypothetical protein